VIIERQNLFLDPVQLSPQCCEAHPRNLWHPFVPWIGDNIEQFLDTIASDRRHDPELSEMSTDRIDHSGLLPDEQMARAMEHQAALLLRGRSRHRQVGVPILATNPIRSTIINRNMECSPSLRHNDLALSSGGIIAHSRAFRSVEFVPLSALPDGPLMV
jgi:hypothetical protein